ncbi:MAG: hypothetical protein H0S80_01060 [Desulfovibrionaceae bacterium]|nr:hypothetical protein [Desulfovibrionaceae bacterium]
MSQTNFLDTASRQAAQWLQPLFPDLSPQTVLHAGATLLGLLALVLFLAAIRLIRRPHPRNTSSTRTDIPRTLQRKGMTVDILAGPGGNKVAARFVVTGVRANRIRCEIIERLDVIRTGKDRKAVCVFAPLKTREGKVNTFTAALIKSDRDGRNPDRIILSTPAEYGFATRRRHVRKRVADQQFMRVKLWLASPMSTDVAFQDAMPHIGVNAFTFEGPDQASNGVVNISDGGLGLSVLNRLLPETCAPGESVVINLFMFNFGEKTFKPYWYAGTVRSMEGGRPGFTRVGIEFTDVGRADPATGRLSWAEL